MTFENYRRAAIGDLTYVENLLLINPELINKQWDGQGMLSYIEKLSSANRYALEKIGIKLSGNREFCDLLAMMEMLVFLPLSEAVYIGLTIGVIVNLLNTGMYSFSRKGWTLLDFAVENGQTEMVIFLILKGAKLDAERLFDIAKKNGRGGKFSIVLKQIIEDRGKKEEIVNNNFILNETLEEIQGYNETLLEAYKRVLTAVPSTFGSIVAGSEMVGRAAIEAYKSSHIGFVDSDFWYDDEHINTLLKRYFPITQNDISVLPALEWNENNIDIHMLIQTRFTNAIGYHPDCFVYFLPLEVNKNHWIGLYVDRTSQEECVWWMDSMGGITEEWKNSIVNILNDQENIGLFENDISAEHIHFLPNRLQNDGFNCGPWVVELLRFFVVNKRFPVAGEIDIGAKRQEHLAILNPKQFSSMLELEGVSEKLDNFGIFSDQSLVTVVGQSPQNNKTFHA